MSLAKIRLNCDMGESFGQWTIGMDDKVMPFIDQANIACGFHASDPCIMRKTVQLAAKYNVTIGAHPSYLDLQGFGRRSLAMSAPEITNMTLYQVGALQAICHAEGQSISYIKPHGALYNDMMKEESIFIALLKAAQILSLPLMVLSSCRNAYYSELAQQKQVPLLFEAFADRAYMPDGSLSPRSMENSVHSTHDVIYDQVKQLTFEKTVTTINGDIIPIQADTLCVHGDNEVGVSLIEKLRSLLDQAS